MSGAEFERRDRREDEREDRSNGDELIPRISSETVSTVLWEFRPVVTGNVDHLAATSTYLERIRRVNPIVVEYIEEVAGRSPKGLDPRYVALAGVFVYRLLELEFARRGKEMPIVQRDIADSLIVDIAPEERYFQELAKPLVTENFELLEVLLSSPIWTRPSIRKVPAKQQIRLLFESALGVYALIEAQATADRFRGP
jgi:hypothetical protein